jgi:thiamine pyrophosphokinase
MRAIILSNGELSSLAVLKSRLREWLEAGAHPLVIAADGGSRYAGLLDLSINVVVGDLDSLDDAERTSLQKNGVQFEKFPAHKDETDLELALLYAVEHRAKEIIVLGAMGGRLDMSPG